MINKPPLITWFTCLLLLSACGAKTTIIATPSVTPGPVTISATINADGTTTLSGGDFQLVGTKDLGPGWDLGFAATLYEAKNKQYTLSVLHQDSNWEVIRQEYAIGRPFEVNFNNEQWVKKIAHDGNGNVVVYVEPKAGSSTPTAGSSTPTVGSSTPTAASTKAVSTSTKEVVVLPDLGLSDPVEFINYYFKNINDRNYQMTWSLLSQNFINRMNSPAQGGYQGYVNFWNTVKQVDIIDVAIQSQNNNSAIVNVNMTIHYEDGSTASWHPQFSLVYDHSRNTWLFN
jgi:hypothetical protein